MTAATLLPGVVLRHGRYSVRLQPRLLLVCALLLLAICACSLLLLATGRLPLAPGEVLRALAGQEQADAIAHRVVWQIRLPRIVTALSAGAALGISGAIFQSVSRNALGSPDVIGFTTGAATGALVQIIVFGQQQPLAVALAAVLAGLLTALAVYLLAWQTGAVASYRLVLIGIGVGALLGAVNGLLLVKGGLDQAVQANLWLAGSLDARTWAHALPVALGTLVLTPLVLCAARPLHLLEMGDDLARQLGVVAERTRLQMSACAVALAALATGAAGPIAFIALAAPQLTLRATGASRLPVVSAALMGALLLVLADLLVQHLPIAMAVPIGRVTGILGGLYLAWLLGRRR
ncbi:Fe(3+)-siderophore ABC transporter permease [Corticibacter populi]|uniref:Fe(3+)-siderophore ABC transporter permease n=2 Tax=Corticibacter populi TaxID=1550736 RepID=A0A3M6QZ06_9BURK|nr:Fe(3+)-siderophore ABC transporter permease [Corticibacter populi]